MPMNVRYELPALGYGYDALEPAYSAEALELHHAGHHKAYVDGANKALDTLAEIRSRGDFTRLNQLEKDLAFNVSGHILHSIFWRNLEPNDGAPPAGRLESRIRAAFGGTDAFKRQFCAAGAGLQGSGWVARNLGDVSKFDAKSDRKVVLTDSVLTYTADKKFLLDDFVKEYLMKTL